MIRLVALDLSGTLVEKTPSTLAMVSELAGGGAVAQSLLEQEHSGVLREREALEAILALSKGVRVADIREKVFPRLVYFDGVGETLAALKSLGVRLALVTTSFEPLAELVAQRFNIDYVVAARPRVRDGKFTGELEWVFVDKGHALGELAERLGFRKDEVVAVGDSLDDVSMFQVAGVGVAFRGEPEARFKADYRIDDFKQLLDIVRGLNAKA
jgi:phosphoserine phosphatase